MGFTLFSRELPFLGLFEAQSERLSEATESLAALFSGEEQTATACARIHELCAESERLGRQVGRELSLTLIRPIERDDVFELNLAFDGTIKAVGAISTRVGLYGLGTRKGAARELTMDLQEIAALIARLLGLINRAESPDELAASISKVAGEAEGFLVTGLGELYESAPSSTGELLDVMKWSQLYDRLEDAVERSKQLASVLTLILLKGV